MLFNEQLLMDMARLIPQRLVEVLFPEIFKNLVIHQSKSFSKTKRVAYQDFQSFNWFCKKKQ